MYQMFMYVHIHVYVHVHVAQPHHHLHVHAHARYYMKVLLHVHVYEHVHADVGVYTLRCHVWRHHTTEHHSNTESLPEQLRKRRHVLMHQPSPVCWRWWRRRRDAPHSALRRNWTVVTATYWLCWYVCSQVQTHTSVCSLLTYDIKLTSKVLHKMYIDAHVYLNLMKDFLR